MSNFAKPENALKRAEGEMQFPIVVLMLASVYNVCILMPWYVLIQS